MNTEIVRARIEPKLKKQVHLVFHKLGITPTQAIRMLYRYVEREQKIPFSLSIPNEETAKIIREAKAGKGLIKSKNLNELFDDLGIK